MHNLIVTRFENKVVNLYIDTYILLGNEGRVYENVQSILEF